MTPLLPDITVNGTTIPAARIAAEAQMHPAPAGNPGLAWRAAAHALTLREALLQEAHRRGLTPDPQETAPGLLETPDEALIRQFLDIAVTPDPVPDTTLRASYDANPARFRAPPSGRPRISSSPQPKAWARLGNRPLPPPQPPSPTSAPGRGAGTTSPAAPRPVPRATPAA